MRLESRTWFLLSLILFAAAIYFWIRGNEYQSRKSKAGPPAVEQTLTNRPGARNAPGATPFKLLSRMANTRPGMPASTAAPGTSTPASAVQTGGAGPATNAFPLRLSNSAKPMRELSRLDTAILMRNAWIDTAGNRALPIPAHLRAQGDPGSYIVQARGPIGREFRADLRDAGAAVIAYIPNNAYLVRVSGESAGRLAALPRTQAVMPYEPYYKLDSKLLPLAVEQKPLAADEWLRITAFPGEKDVLAGSVALLGGEVLGEERTPFGPQLLVKPAPTSLPEIARLASVQTVERYYHRELLTDQTRVVVGVSASGSSTTNYLNLTGSNVMVNVNDSGVDSTHPDLAGRVTGDTPKVLSDPFAHGTHIAGIIAGNGSQSSTVTEAPPGSETNASFHGMAPLAEVFALPFEAFPEVNRFLNDIYLAETAARTNATMSKRPSGPMVSNNSWAYVGVNEYDSSSARFDAAVRDAVPEGLASAGEQPMIFVFAAGNSGEGTDAGEGGEAGSIASPANAKNVISVGALEHLRNITNAVFTTNIDGSISTNALFLGVTDSLDEVASFSSRGNIGIGVEGEFGRFKPDVVAPGTFIISTRGKAWNLENQFDTNSPQYEILRDLNEPLAPYYRYETGTSQAAPVVSGMLALMQEFFEQRLPAGLRRTNSPAMMKALLINGARSAGPLYNLQVQSSVNYQGWGKVNLTNMLPEMMLSLPEAQWPVRMFDQNPTNALATSQSRSWSISVSTNAEFLPLRVTLVWTDPPGNPNAAIKLVNDLDLVVSNTVSGLVYYGNNIPANSDFTDASSPDAAPVLDNVNNVENVFIREPNSTNFVVTVTARRVNVTATPNFNAITGQPNDVVQDYALVIACGDPTATNAFTVTPLTPAPALTVQPVNMTNGLPLLNQRSGANPTLTGLKNGTSNQWNFYVFTNTFVTNDFSTLTNGTNVAFVTFFPPNVARSRNESADIDLYVSKDPRLVELEPTVTDAAWKSVTRGGTEFVVFTNANLGDIFYIGVKSEDQQSGEFGLIALSSDQPFEENRDGARILHGMPVPQSIPDGTPSNPGRATVFAIGISPLTIQKVIVTNVLTHELVGDLSLILDHDQTSVVLHNHTLNNGFPSFTNAVFVYDDQGFGDTSGARRSDGPGSLNDFAGQQGNGVWMFNAVDNAPNRTGRVENLTIRIEPFLNADLGAAGEAGISGTVGPNQATCYYIDVPPEATNLIVNVSQLSGPLDVFISHGSLPTQESFDKMMHVDPPGGTMMLGANDEPTPLGVGRYFVCLYNPGASEVQFHIATVFEFGVGLDFKRTLVGTNAVQITDDGIITSTVTVPVDKQVADVQVGVRIDHPRSSDLVLHLISPEGTRLLLAENRGGPNLEGYGSGYGTNIAYTVFTEDTNLLDNLAPIKFSLPPWTNSVASTNPLTFTDSFEGATNGVYQTNQSFVGWTVFQGAATLQGPGNELGVLPRTGTNFVELDSAATPAGIFTSFGTVPGKDYMLRFYYQRNPSAPAEVSQALQVYYGPPMDLRPPSKFIDASRSGWQATNITFTATSNTTALAFAALTSVGPLVDAITVGDVITGTNVYVLPEESLDLLRGQRAQGDWTLEIWDNRQGPVGLGEGALINWELQLKYGNPPDRGTTLTNGFTFSGTIEGNQTNYFVVDVCDTSHVGFATLIGPFEPFFNEGKIQLLIDRDGYPTGNPETDDYAPLPNDVPLDETFESGMAAIQFTDDPHQPAPLIPGGRLFFAVHNLFPGETNSFDLQVSLDNDTCGTPRPITRLENDIAVTNIVAPSGILFDYYVFNVSPIAIEAQFEVMPKNGDVGMVLSYGLPLPDLATFDYKSDNPGITNELIVLTNNSAPVSLTPGDWYLGVYNNSTNATIYSVRASEVLDTNINLVTLTNGIPLDFTLLQGAGLTNFFVLRVPDPVPGVKFELYNLNGNADLFIDFNKLPSPTNYFLSNSASPTQPVDVEVLTNDLRPDLRGNWVLEVINKQATNLLFTLRASLLEPTTNAPPTGTNRVFDPDINVTATNICFSWDATVGLEYQLEAKKTLGDANWVILFGPSAATNSSMSFCMNLPIEYSFFQVVELGGETPPPPTEDQYFDPEISVTATNLCFSWGTTNGINYRLEGKESLSVTNWQTLFGPELGTGATMSHCIDLPTNLSVFRVVAIGGEKPPPPTQDQYFDPEVSVTATNLCFSWGTTNGLQYRLEGKENLSVTNWQTLFGPQTATGTTMQHCIDLPTDFSVFRVVVIGGQTPPPTTEDQYFDPDISVTATNVCFSWGTTNGLQYRFEAKETLSTTNWQTLFGPQAGTGATMEYCVALPTDFSIFRVVQMGGGTPPPPITGTNVVNPGLVFSATNLCLAWPGQVGASYRVQGREAIAVGSWTNLTGLIVATNTSMSYCLNLPTPYQFFQVLEFAGTTNQPPSEPTFISLESGVLVTNSVAATTPDYYLFNVSPGAVSAQFLATPTNGDIGLVLRYGLPLPDLTSSDYRSDRPGVTNESISITDSSIPVSLQPGDWYLGVFNKTTNPVSYTIRASEVLDTNLNFIRLTNAVPRTFTQSAGTGLTNFFLFKVSDPYPGVKFEVYDVRGDADLLVAIDTTPSPTVNVIRETAPVTVELLTNTIPDLRGNWVLGILNNRPGTNLTFTIRASFLGATNPPPATNLFIDPGLVFDTNGLCLTWSSQAGTVYDLQGKMTIADPRWTNVATVTAVGPATTHCLSTNSPYAFFQVVGRTNSVPGGTGSTNEVTMRTPAVLANGRLQLVWDAETGASYAVQFTTNLAPVIQWTTLTNIVSGGTNGIFTDPVALTNGVIRFYRVVQP